MAVRNRLRELLAERTMSQGELAKLAGLTRPTVNWIINGRYLPKIDTALRIARVLRVPVERLWTLEEGTVSGTGTREKRAAGAG